MYLMYNIVFEEIVSPDLIPERSNVNWFDTSFKSSDNAVGELRFPSASNANYESKHPIFNNHSERIGFLVKARESLGYTYKCVYNDYTNCFFISGIRGLATVGSISIIEPKGRFIFSPNELKFQCVHQISLPAKLIDTFVAAYKLIHNSNTLFSLSTHGLFSIDTKTRKLNFCTIFEEPLHERPSLNLSDDESILAIVFFRGYQDPLSGESVIYNILQIYNMRNGDLLGEQKISSETRSEYWRITFLQNKSLISIKLGDENYCFNMVYKGIAL